MRTEVESSITGHRVVTKYPRPHSGLVWFCCSWRLHWYDVGDVSSFPEGEMEEHFTLTPFIIKDPSERGPVLLSTLPVVYIPTSFPCFASFGHSVTPVPCFDPWTPSMDQENHQGHLSNSPMTVRTGYIGGLLHLFPGHNNPGSLLTPLKCSNKTSSFRNLQK